MVDLNAEDAERDADDPHSDGTAVVRVPRLAAIHDDSGKLGVGGEGEGVVVVVVWKEAVCRCACLRVCRGEASSGE